MASTTYEEAQKIFLWYKQNILPHLNKIYLIKYRKIKILWIKKTSLHFKLLLKNGIILDNYLLHAGNKLTSFLFLQDIITSLDIGFRKNMIISVTKHPLFNKLRISITPYYMKRNKYVNELVASLKSMENNMQFLYHKKDKVKVDFIRIIAEKQNDKINIRLAALIEETPFPVELLDVFNKIYYSINKLWNGSFSGVLPEEYLKVWEI